MTIESVNSAFYADPAALATLKREAGTQSADALRETAKQFESLFTTMMLKSMRAASPGDPYGSDQQDFYTDMFDQQLATQLSKGKGLGLADVLVRQLMQGAGVGGAVTPGQAAGSAAGAEASANWPPRNAEEFVKAIRPAASEAAATLGVDVDAVIAHAALETGWGKSVPTDANGHPSFNLFGIKAGGSWKGSAQQASTHEFFGGALQRVSAEFRAYDSPEQSIQDYVGLLKNNPRYAGALGTGEDIGAFARGLVRGGYATDPDYAAKLTAVAARLKSIQGEPITQATLA